MELQIRPMVESEKLYCYSQVKPISINTGHIGYLRADFGESGREFYFSFHDFCENLKTEEFVDDLQEFIDALRNDSFLKDRDSLAEYCVNHPECDLGSGREFGIRADTSAYTYMLRLNPNKAEYNLYCFCYIRNYLDKHLQKAEKGIPFYDSSGNELFRIQDGDSIRVIMRSSKRDDHLCRFIDEYRFQLGYCPFHRNEFIRTYGSKMDNFIPLRRSLPEQCYSTLLNTGQVILIKRGETGYFGTDIPMASKDSAKMLVTELNQKLGITPAQFEAMKAGSMFGFQVPAADPANYSECGEPIRSKETDREIAPQ